MRMTHSFLELAHTHRYGSMPRLKNVRNHQVSLLRFQGTGSQPSQPFSEGRNYRQEKCNQLVSGIQESWLRVGASGGGESSQKRMGEHSKLSWTIYVQYILQPRCFNAAAWLEKNGTKEEHQGGLPQLEDGPGTLPSKQLKDLLNLLPLVAARYSRLYRSFQAAGGAHGDYLDDGPNVWFTVPSGCILEIL